MAPTHPPPSFLFTSPSDKHLIFPSSSCLDGKLVASDLISTSCFPPWKTGSSSPKTESDFSTNAPTTPPPDLRSMMLPRPMVPEKLPVNSKQREKRAGSVSLGHSPRSRSAEQSHLARGRTLRANVLHQRVYHPGELSPLHLPEAFTSCQEPSVFVLDKDSLPQVSPLAPSPSKARYIRGPPAESLYKRLLPNPLLRRILSLPDSPLLWLALYFTLNLSLTLYNKSVLIHFPFPYTLTALHALCGTIGTFILLRMDSGPSKDLSGTRALTSVSPLHHSPIPKLSARESLVLFLFSILYTLNIVVSNASLRLVTVPFHQVVRASTPFFTIMFSSLLLGKRCTKQKLLSLLPVVVGVGFATYGDYYFTAVGFFLTLLGTFLAALKTILTHVILVKPRASALPVSSEISHHPSDNKLLNSTFTRSSFSSLWNLVISHIVPPSPSASPKYGTKALSDSSSGSSFSIPKLSLGPIHLLYLLSPLAFIQTLFLAYLTGELKRVHFHLCNPATAFGTTSLGALGAKGRVWLLLNGVLAFFLNVVSFNANRRVGALGMSVAANVKQVLTVLCAVVIFDLTITPANGVGIVLTLIGGALYAAVELKEKEEKRNRNG